MEQTVIDVRSRDEYRAGHVKGSINIPLQNIPSRLEEIKEMKMPIILCCASGFRSGEAEKFLNKNSVACTNGGGWKDVQDSLNL